MSADFSTWDRATLEQFAQEATDKLVAMAEAQPVAYLWCLHGVCSPHMHKPDIVDGWEVKPLYTSAPTIPAGFRLVSEDTLKRWGDTLETVIAAAPQHKESE